MYKSDIKKSTRDGFARALGELSANQNIYLVSADLSNSMGMSEFMSNAPERFAECGIAEQNSVTVAAGICMTNQNYSAIFASFAEFLPMRCLDQIRISVCMQNLNVKLIGGHSGLSYGGDGESIQTFEDVAIMRTLPNMTVLVPASEEEAYRMTLNLPNISGPVYMRLNREPDPEIFESRKCADYHGIVKKGADVLFIANGTMVSACLESSKILESEMGLTVGVYNCSTLKPLPIHEIIELAKNYNHIFTCEEHQISGGLGGLISEVLSEYYPKKITRIGIHDKFGQSGTVEELRRFYQVDSVSISKKVRQILFG